MELTLPKPFTLSKIFSIVSEPMTTLQIIPHFNITNGIKIEKIINSLYSLDIPIHKRFKFVNNTLIYQRKRFFSYAIYIEKNNISFYYYVPFEIKDWFIQRVYSSWNNMVTIVPTSNYFDNFNNCVEWQLNPKYESYKSLRDDYRDTPIPTILSINNDLEGDDKVMIEFSFTPVTNDIWKDDMVNTQQKFRKGLIEDNLRVGKGWVILEQLTKLLDNIFDISNIILEVKPNKRIYYYNHKTNEMLESYNPTTNTIKYNTNKNKLSSASKQKFNHNGFKGKLRILSQSNNPIRQDIYAKTVELAFMELSDDNEFKVFKKSKLNKVEPMRINFIYDNFIYSSKEIGQLLQLPTKQWQKEYPVEKVEVQEINLPSVLLQGGIQIGTAKYKGQSQNVYWNNTDRDVACLPKCWFGIQGSGKTEALKRYAIESVENGRGLFVLDGIQNCELSDSIRDYLPKDFPEEKIIELNLSDLEYIVPLSWNEIDVSKIEKETDRLKFSNYLAQELIKFLDSLVEDRTEKLSPKMKRYLSNAGLLTFSIKDTTLMDVLYCLIDIDKRYELISKSNLSPENRIIKTLKELDDPKTNDTRLSLIQGVIDRLDLLLGDYVLSNLFSTNGTNKIDFSYWINNNYVVLCKMPQDELNDLTIKTLTTFLISKIWFAKLMLGKNINHTVVICDEVHRTSLKFENIREMRKYGLEYVFSAHQPSDFKHILPTLKSAGCSFILLTTTKENIKHFETEIRPFTIEEVLDLKIYHGLCICNYDKQYISFEIALPPLYKRDRYVDRQYLSKKCSLKYGTKIK